jgi:predicted HicB family RNase H-like nuclease
MLTRTGLELAPPPPRTNRMETHAVLTESLAATNGQSTATQSTESNPQYQQLLQVAERLCTQSPDWVTFFREVMGIDGVVRRTFPNFDDLTAFERSEEFAQIQKLLVKLRENKATADSESEPTRVITVRLPKSMHEYLRTEAHDLRTSMNKLCISKLLQMIEQDMIPADQTALPKRRNTTTPSLTGAPTTSGSNGSSFPSDSSFKTNY